MFILELNQLKSFSSQSINIKFYTEEIEDKQALLPLILFIQMNA